MTVYLTGSKVHKDHKSKFRRCQICYQCEADCKGNLYFQQCEEDAKLSHCFSPHLSYILGLKMLDFTYCYEIVNGLAKLLILFFMLSGLIILLRSFYDSLSLGWVIKFHLPTLRKGCVLGMFQSVTFDVKIFHVERRRGILVLCCLLVWLNFIASFQGW